MFTKINKNKNKDKRKGTGRSGVSGEYVLSGYYDRLLLGGGRVWHHPCDFPK